MLLSSQSFRLSTSSSSSFFSILLSLKVKDDIFGITDFSFRLKNTNVYKDVPDFFFFDHKDVSNFLEFQLKLYFFSTSPSFSKFWGLLLLGGLRQWLNWPSERVGPEMYKLEIKRNSKTLFHGSKHHEL